MSPKTAQEIIENQVVRHRGQDTSFNKKDCVKLFEKLFLEKRYSI
jgi:hypothetical protein